MMNKLNNPGSLIVIGSGIKSISHLSTEAIAHIKQSDKVMYSVNEPIMETWIKQNNSNIENLDSCIKGSSLRLHAYRSMTECILENLKKFRYISVVFYGHPTVFASSALEAVLEAKKQGFFTKIIPGISAEDCLFADLMIDPASHGCQSYETTDLLIRKRHVDVSSHLILWQVGLIGALGSLKDHDNTRGLILLQNYLIKFYKQEHMITCYEASLYPHLEPTLHQFPLEKLSSFKFTSLSTLYIPPAYKARLDQATINAMGISIPDLQ